MTVVKFTESGDAVCRWFRKDGASQSETFPVHTLRHPEAPPAWSFG